MTREWAGDLEILDTLELLNSTVEAAKWLKIAQSTCSRRYRTFSDQYALEFDRDGGRYKVNNNLDVLTDMRKAAQVMRVRRGELRFVRGWQLALRPINSLGSLCREWPIRPMSTMELLVLLEKRLLDIAIMGVMECKNLLDTSIENSKLGRYPLGAQLAHIPVCLYDLELIGTNDNLLARRKGIAADQFEGYSSRGLPVGKAPVLMAQLNKHFLGTDIYDYDDYRENEWEGFASNSTRLSYTAPFLLPDLQSRGGVLSISYPLGITECLAVVGHKDVIRDSAFGQYFQMLYAEINSIIAPVAKKVKWLR